MFFIVLAFLATPFVFFYALFVEVKYQPGNAVLTIALFVISTALLFAIAGLLAACLFLYIAGFVMVNWLHGDDLTFIREFGKNS